MKKFGNLRSKSLSSLVQAFLEATHKFYDADLKEVDFMGAPEACRAEINTWVEEQTESENIHNTYSILFYSVLFYSSARG